MVEFNDWNSNRDGGLNPTAGIAPLDFIQLL